MITRTRAVRPALAAALVLAAALAVPATAQNPLKDPVAVGDLDGDGMNERLVVREISCLGPDGATRPPCGLESVSRRIQVDLVDECAGVERRTAILPRVEEGIDQLAIREADGDLRRREFIVAAYSGVSGQVGSGMLGRLVAGPDGCAKVRRLFTFGPVRARTPKPRGASYHQTGTLSLRSLRRDFRGKELRYSETWFRRADPGCCPTWSATIDMRYDRRTDRYVRYRTRTTRLRRR